MNGMPPDQNQWIKDAGFDLLFALVICFLIAWALN